MGEPTGASTSERAARATVASFRGCTELDRGLSWYPHLQTRASRRHTAAAIAAKRTARTAGPLSSLQTPSGHPELAPPIDAPDPAAAAAAPRRLPPSSPSIDVDAGIDTRGLPFTTVATPEGEIALPPPLDLRDARRSIAETFHPTPTRKRLPDHEKILVNAMTRTAVDPVADAAIVAIHVLFAGEEPVSRAETPPDPFRGAVSQRGDPVIVRTPDGPVEIPTVTERPPAPVRPGIRRRMLDEIERLRRAARPTAYDVDEDEAIGEAMEQALALVITLGVTFGIGGAPHAVATSAGRLASRLAARGTSLAIEAARPAIIRIAFTEAMAADAETAQFLRFNLEWAQSELGVLRRGKRVAEDDAFRAAARRWADAQGASREGLDAMHALDSVANPLAESGDVGTTYYFGNRSVNQSFGNQLMQGMKAAGLEVGDPFVVEFLGFPDFAEVAPRAPALASPPDLPIRTRIRR